jgi:outer membrane lipoprotein SlyB
LVVGAIHGAGIGGLSVRFRSRVRGHVVVGTVGAVSWVSGLRADVVTDVGVAF